MSDLPFGLSSGDDPERNKGDKNPNPAGANPFGLGGGAGFNPADLGQLFSRLGEMFAGAGSAMASGKGGAVNYDLARKLASSSIGFSAPVSESTAKAVTDAVHLADTWLDGATALPAGATRAAAWSPQDWVDNTLETWKRLCDPMAEQISTVWTSALPEEAKAMAGPLMALMTQMGSMAFGSQLGQALGRLSKEVLTSTDIGLPLGPKGVAALMPTAFGRWHASGLNERFRFYRYRPGQRFAAHYDGSYQRNRDENSWLTLLVYLNDDFAGGTTRFDLAGVADPVVVQPQAGMALVFMHDRLHQGDEVTAGTKYVLRTDVMYRREHTPATESLGPPRLA